MTDSDLCATHAGITRSEVGSFTVGSRRRLMHLLARLRRDSDGLLVTLTFPAWAAPDRDGWHTSWDRYRVKMTRRFPLAAGVWRREFTKAGTVHLHLLLYGVRYADLRSWLPSAWADCVDAPERERRERVGTSVEQPRKWCAVNRYIAKYVSKRDVAAVQPFGRWYGVFGRDRLPWSGEVSASVPDHIAVRLIRAGRKWIAADRRRRGQPRRRGVPAPRYGLTLMSADPSAWSRLADLLVTQERIRSRATA